MLGAILERSVLLGIDWRHRALDLKSFILVGSFDVCSASNRVGLVLHAAMEKISLLLAANRAAAYTQVSVLCHKAIHLLETVLSSIPIV